MEPEQGTSAVRKILGGKGKPLHTHEIHLRRTKNKGYIAKHDLRDKDGNAPTDGQRGEAEYALANKAAMLAHVDQHMGGSATQPGDDEQEDQDQPQGAAAQGAPPAGPVQ